jgi:hypothetical protein
MAVSLEGTPGAPGSDSCASNLFALWHIAPGTARPQMHWTAGAPPSKCHCQQSASLDEGRVVCINCIRQMRGGRFKRRMSAQRLPSLSQCAT